MTAPSTTISGMSRPELSLVNATGIGLLRLSLEHDVLDMNMVAGGFLGRPVRSMLGRPIGLFVTQESSLPNLLARCGETRGDISADRIALTDHSDSAELFDVLVSWHGEDGFGVALIPAGRTGLIDVSGGLGQFAKVFGHEVKTPLAAISGAAQLLARKLEAPEEQQLLELLRAETERLSRVISRLTDLEPLRAPKAKSVNVHEITDAVLSNAELVHGEEVVFKREYDPSLPPIRIDPDHLHLALQNIVSNAIEAPVHNDEARVVVVSTRFSLNAVLPGRNTVGALQIRVVDNGAGFDGHEPQQVLKPFFTTKPNGSGIGLSVVQDVIHGHQGVLDVKSRPGRTEICLLLPLHPDR